MKDEEIYTIFDTKKILNKPATVQISKTSGLAGVATGSTRPTVWKTARSWTKSRRW